MPQIERPFFALAPNGVVHQVVATGINAARALQKFRRMHDIHGFEVLEAAEVTSFLACGETFVHEIQHAFPEANGRIVEHNGPTAFFEAVGYDALAKRRCIARHRKLEKDSIDAHGRLVWVDLKPYRVELLGRAT
ncbi:hypothetical protein [Microvirga massiliensis]|uniref:hypothetical protein n=1 Tax=Microvirga massiliensis TaxID=1033741 RepID=UPI00062BB7F9|nr:hypothetical protein [Microvirga massiliensis]